MSSKTDLQSKDWIRNLLKESMPNEAPPKEIPTDTEAHEAYRERTTAFLLEETSLTNMERPSPEEFREVVKKRL